MASESTDLQDLQNEWKEMFQHKLPAAATSKSQSQVGSLAPQNHGYHSISFTKAKLTFKAKMASPRRPLFRAYNPRFHSR